MNVWLAWGLLCGGIWGFTAIVHQVVIDRNFYRRIRKLEREPTEKEVKDQGDYEFAAFLIGLALVILIFCVGSALIGIHAGLHYS
jgi:hypothetical protein